MGLLSLGNTLSLKQRLRVLIFAVAIGSLLLCVTTFLLYQLQHVRSGAVRELEVVTDVVSTSLSAAVVFNDASGATELLKSLSAQKDITRADLYTVNGSRLSGFRSPKAKLTPIVYRGVRAEPLFSDDTLVIVRPVMQRDEAIGALYVERSLAESYRLLTHSILLGALVILLGGFVAWILGRYFGRKVSEPLVQVATVMQRIAIEKDFSARFANASNDEVGQLMRCFNQMLAEIALRDDRLTAHQLVLEAQVSDRTRELSAEVERRARTEQALRREQEQLRTIIRRCPVAIALLDMDLVYIAHSDSWCGAFELPQGQFIGKLHHEVAPLVAKRWAQNDQRVLKGASEHQEEDTLDLENGKTIHLRWTRQPWFTADGKQGGIIIAADRIDDLVLSKRQAIHNAEIKAEFIANMSHELRTPLNGILGFTSLLQDDPNLSADQRESLEAVQASGRLLLSVIGDILDFSKLEKGKLALERLPFRPAEVIENVVVIMQGEAGRRRINLVQQVDENLESVWCEGDSYRIQQVLLNLIGNALKFTEKGSVTVELIGKKISDSRIHLTFAVTDTGIGISSDKLGVIFEPFAQEDGSTTRRFGGTGLGLSICQQLVDLMNGRMQVESILGEGSRFSFELDLDVVVRPSLEVDKPVGSVTSSPQTDALSILVAEDNNVNQRLIKALLDRGGHAVTVVTNGRDAIEQCQKQTFDLILMDLQMPIMGGIDATRAIRGSSSLSSRMIPIVALTAHAFEEHRNACNAAGMSGYLTKPIQRQELQAILSKVAKEKLERLQDKK